MKDPTIPWKKGWFRRHPSSLRGTLEHSRASRRYRARIGHSIDDKMVHDGSKAHALARALARVLARETVHAIDPDIPHGPEASVMSENLTPDLLLGERLSFHESTTKRLLERLLTPFEAAAKS